MFMNQSCIIWGYFEELSSTAGHGEKNSLRAHPCEAYSGIACRLVGCGVAGDNALAVAQLPDAGCRDDHDCASVVILFDPSAGLVPRGEKSNELSPFQLIELPHRPAVSVMHGAVSFPTSKAVALFLNSRNAR